MQKKENFADVLAQSMNDILESEEHKAIFAPPKVKTAMKKEASARGALSTTVTNLFTAAKVLSKMGLIKSAQEVFDAAEEMHDAMTPEQLGEIALAAEKEASIVVEE